LRKCAQLSSADAVYMTKRGTTYKRKVSAPPLGCHAECTFAAPSNVHGVMGVLEFVCLEISEVKIFIYTNLQHCHF
jgi:hypothetical protein